MIVANGPRPLLRPRPGDRRRNTVSRSQRDLSVSALFTFDFIRNETRPYVRRFEQRAGTRLAELTNLKPMTLVRCLDRLESWGCLERRRDLADRRAHRIYLKAMGKPLADEIWRLVNLTHRDVLASLPRKNVELMIALLERVQRNLASLRPLAKPIVGGLAGRKQWSRLADHMGA